MASGIEIVTGVFLLVFGLSLLINASFWAGAFKRMCSESQQTFTLLWLSLICGVLMVLGHNLWVGDWRVLVTIAGWGTLIKSIVLILAPRMLGAYASWPESALATWLRVGGAFWTIGGGVVTYFSLVAG